jgi:hypothetical protein
MRKVALALAGILAGCAPTAGLRLEPVKFANTRKPTFVWETFPSEGTYLSDRPFITEVTYDLRVWREDSSVGFWETTREPSELVYERHGLAAPGHTLDILLPDGSYRWSIRPRFLLRGELRVGEWSQEGSEIRAPVYPARGYARFTVP